MSGIGFLFPGQGAQHVGMGRRLSEECSAAAELYARATDVLGYDLAAACFDGPQQELDATVISQPAIFVTSLAALEWLRADRPELIEACAGTAGLSLGPGVRRCDGIRGRVARCPETGRGDAGRFGQNPLGDGQPAVDGTRAG